MQRILTFRRVVGLATVVSLLAASASACAGHSRRSGPPAVVAVELHRWIHGPHGREYFITRVDVESGCVATSVHDQLSDRTYIVRDCTFAEELRPRIAELIALFELDPEPSDIGERFSFDRDRTYGTGIVFERAKDSRWTSDSELLFLGQYELHNKIQGWFVRNQIRESATPGATRLVLHDLHHNWRRLLSSDGIWLCESTISTSQFETFVISTSGRIEPTRAAELIDSFAGLAVATDPDSAAEARWIAAVTRDGQEPVELRGDPLAERWDGFAGELDRDCSIDPPPLTEDRWSEW